MNLQFTDRIVECSNPQALDATLQQLGPAVVVEGSWNGKTCTVRIFGDPGFIKFAIVQQGYGRIVEDGTIAAGRMV